MTPAEEDAIYAQALAEAAVKTDKSEPGLVRLAIRAAVAAERERCAKVCEATHLRRSAMGMKDGYNAIMQCADAIRAAGK